ncbi:MAG: hypothetical protein JJU02_05665 [Cryomorphaceae bacterium]|nr:hypothetical protein [Cryomorphaceae bacterium]
MKKSFVRGTFVMLIMLFFQGLSAQVNVRDSISPGWLITIGGGYFFPDLDLKEKFGNSYTMGIGTFYKTGDNWLWGVSGDFWFGNVSHDRPSILRSIGNDNGEVFDHFGNFANVMTYQRGWIAGFDVGKIFNNDYKLGNNANSGLFFTVGAGYMQHRIRVESANRSSIIYQIEGDFQRGYDRLNMGWMTRANIGYILAHEGKTINFMLSFEVMYGETVNVRGFNWDTQMEDNDLVRNLTYGIRLSWFLPIYDKNAQTYFFN